MLCTTRTNSKLKLIHRAQRHKHIYLVIQSNSDLPPSLNMEDVVRSINIPWGREFFASEQSLGVGKLMWNAEKTFNC